MLDTSSTSTLPLRLVSNAAPADCICAQYVESWVRCVAAGSSTNALSGFAVIAASAFVPTWGAFGGLVSFPPPTSSVGMVTFARLTA